MKSLKSIAYHYVYFIVDLRSHRTETLQWQCYNNGSDRFSCSDCNAFNDFIVCDRSLSM